MSKTNLTPANAYTYGGNLAMSLPDNPICTAEDYWNLPEGERAELIDGQLYALASPSRIHQEIIIELTYHFQHYIKSNKGNCKIYAAPFAVNLNANDQTFVEPDISIICEPDKLSDRGCEGAPDLVIEVVSPSSHRMDYIKKLLYMQMPVSANTGSLILPPSRRPFIDLKRRMPLISFPLTRTSKLVSMKIFKSISQNYSNKQPQDHLTNFQAFSLVVSKSRQTFGDEPVCRDSDYHRLKAWILFYLTILTSSPFRSSLRIFFSTSLRAIIT